VSSWFKKALGINSPSKVMAELSKYIPEGVSVGIDKNKKVVYDSIQKLSKGIKVNTKEMCIDANEYVDFSSINGQIQTKSSLYINGEIANKISDATYNAFCRAMRDEGVTVNIEAKTEDGVIVRKVTQGFNEYIRQTGELPFPIPV